MTLPLFPEPPRPPPPPREERPKPPPYVPNVADVKRRDALILGILRKGPATLGEILAQAGPQLSHSATVCDLSFLYWERLVERTTGDDPVYSLARHGSVVMVAG